MRQVFRRFFAIVLAGGAVASLAIVGLPDRATYTGVRVPNLGNVAAEVGALAPPIIATTTQNTPLNTTAPPQITLINFWATWCVPCRVEMQELQALHEAYGESVHIIGINMGEDLPTILAWTQAHGITYDIVPDYQHAISHLYRVRAQPMSVLVQAGGRVREVIFGVTTAERLLASIRHLQDEQSP